MKKIIYILLFPYTLYSDLVYDEICNRCTRDIGLTSINNQYRIHSYYSHWDSSRETYEYRATCYGQYELDENNNRIYTYEEKYQGELIGVSQVLVEGGWKTLTEHEIVQKISKCFACFEPDTNFDAPQNWQARDDLYYHNNCSTEETGSIEQCETHQGNPYSRRTECCTESMCFVPPCDLNDTEFPELEENQMLLFEWSEAEDRSNKCQDINGTVQERIVDCNSTYRCVVDKCNKPDTKFPPKANNQRVSFTWKEPEDRSAECQAMPYAEVQSRTIDCKKEHRCLLMSCQVEQNEPISSYVSPKDRSFHEDITITGADFGLHYSSANITDTTIAHGWSLSSHARLVGNKLYLGNGTLYAFKIATIEANNTVVPYGANELLFDANGTHLSTRDLYTKAIEQSFSYDTEGHLSHVTDKYGQTTTLNRDANGTLTSITAPHGQMTYVSIDTNGDLVEVQYEDTSSYTFEYENHLMTVEREPNGNAFLHFFDENGSVIKVIDAEQGVWRFGSKSQETYGLNTVVRADGDVIRYKNHFLKNGMLVSQKILPTGDKVRYSNAVDETKSITTSCGMKTVNVYRTNSDGTLYLDPYSHKRVLKSTVTTTPGGLRQVKSYLDKHIYSDEGNLTRLDHISRLNGKRSIYRKDFVYDREIRFSPEDRRDYLYYDDKMQHIIGNKPHGLAKTDYVYDAFGRVIEEKVGKRTTTYTYDDRANLHTVTNPLGQTTTYTYDSRDRISGVIYADGTQEHFTYDSNGNLVTRTVPTPTDHLFTYNGVNKRSGYTSPEQKVTTYSYDKQRRLTKTTKASGKTIENIYTKGRLTTLKTPEGDTTYDYSCQSNVSSITHGTERMDYSYDGTLLTSITQSGVLNQSITYSYNNDFLPSSITYAGATQNYSYDADNYLTGAGDYNITRTNKDKNITITDGKYYKNTKINGYGEAYKLEDNKLFIQLSRNDGGQITRKVETLEDKKTVYKYSYDTRGKLTQVKRNNKVVEQYVYDANGNRTSATTSTGSVTASYTLDDNLIVYGQNIYRYDDDGYLKEKVTPEGTTTYTYGTLGELRAVQTPDANITYVHNALNQRVAKLINGEVVEKYLWQNLTTLLAVYDKDDNLVQRFGYAGDRMPVAMTDANGTKYYLHYDQVGSLRAVSNANHHILKEITYDTYGNILEDSNTDFKVPFGFAGGLYDGDTKLTRFGYRDYDAFTGKWTAKDPIGFDGGDSNLYGYVLGDPVNFIDPNGLNGFMNRNGGHGKNRSGSYLGGLFGGICGAEGSFSAKWIILDITPEACQKHDDCYSDCSKTQQECDLAFYKENSIYAQAVWLFGKPAYDNAQKDCPCK